MAFSDTPWITFPIHPLLFLEKMVFPLSILLQQNGFVLINWSLVESTTHYWMRGELQSLTKGITSMEECLHKAKSLALALHGVGKSMDDDDFVICLLRSLGSEFDPIVAAINSWDTFPSLEEVINKLWDFEIRISSNHELNSTVVLYTNHATPPTQHAGGNISHSEHSQKNPPKPKGNHGFGRSRPNSGWTQ